MVEPLTKLLPLMVSVNPESPATLLAGERVLVMGTGTRKVTMPGA